MTVWNYLVQSSVSQGKTSGIISETSK